MSLASFSLIAALLSAQIAPTAPSEGPIDISADRSSADEVARRVTYSGDVNIIRGDTRLRADEVEVVFDEGFRSPLQIEARGAVYYVTPTGIAHGDEGLYDLEAGTIEMTGSVVLTQGCNVSTGNRMIADLDGGTARLTGGGEGENQRVRSVFFEGGEEQTGQVAPESCAQPEIPGDGPRAFDDAG